MQALAAHLSDRDQETGHASIDEFAAALVEPHILNHRDGTVRLLAACSLADVLRIYAPNAPYSTSQLTVRQAQSPALVVAWLLVRMRAHLVVAVAGPFPSLMCDVRAYDLAESVWLVCEAAARDCKDS